MRTASRGFVGHLDSAPFDGRLIATFIITGLVGTYVGARLAHRLPAARLRLLFALFVIGLAALLLYDNLPKLLG